MVKMFGLCVRSAGDLSLYLKPIFGENIYLRPAYTNLTFPKCALKLGDNRKHQTAPAYTVSHQQYSTHFM